MVIVVLVLVLVVVVVVVAAAVAVAVAVAVVVVEHACRHVISPTYILSIAFGTPGLYIDFVIPPKPLP